MADGPTSPKRVCLKQEEIESLPRDELIMKWKEHDIYVNHLEEKRKSGAASRDDDSKVSEEKLKQQHIEAARRENTLVMRLTSKEQELQEYMNQIQEMKQSQSATTAQLRSMLLDPAVNLVFTRMQKEMGESKEKLEQTQNELNAWKFTPDSQTGKRLMAKCRMLYQENEELGKVLSSGRIAKLEGEIALEKTLVQELKDSQAELDELLGEIDEDVEGMQSMICVLQQQLKESKEQVTQLQEENTQLKAHVNKQVLTENTEETETSNTLPDNVSNNHSPQHWQSLTETSHCEAEEIRSPSEATVTDNHFTETGSTIDKQEEEGMEVDSTSETKHCDPPTCPSTPPPETVEHTDQVTTVSSNHTSNSPPGDPPSPDTRTSPTPLVNSTESQNGDEVRTKDLDSGSSEKTTAEETSLDKVQNGVSESWPQAESTV